MNKTKRAGVRLSRGGFVLPSPEEVRLAATRSPSGNESWSALQLAEWGVPWPPPKGWRQILAALWRAAPEKTTSTEETGPLPLD